MSQPDPQRDKESVPERPLRVMISGNSSWNLVNFRSALIRALIAKGCHVIAAVPADQYSDRLVNLGCQFLPVDMDTKGTNPVRDARLLADYRLALKQSAPDVYLAWTIKPNIYGSLAAASRGVPTINNVSGLGTAFLHGGVLQTVVKALYRVGLSRSRTVFFQNSDDRQLFLNAGLVRQSNTKSLPGSGVDLSAFAMEPLPGRSDKPAPVFLLIARMLWDKGVGEYVKAAQVVKAAIPEARFQLLGFLDVENRTAIPRSTVEQWVAEGHVEYMGVTDDVRPFIAQADCVVLPSYREGTPRTLLEAMAMGRPLVATDVPGCRETVKDGVNGWLCKVKDPNDLADKMLRMARALPEERAEMGRQSRQKAEREFDERLVIDAYLEAIDDAVGRRVRN